MKPDSSLSSNNRREFVKKSLAASIVAAQPSILAGLICAEGGGGGGTTTDPWETTVPETTDPWETGTTVPETTVPETTAVGGCWVEGSPVGVSPPTDAHSSVGVPNLVYDGKTYGAKAMMLTTPADGKGGSVVTITADLHAWKQGDPLKTAGTLKLEGQESSCVFSATTDSPAGSDPLSFSDNLMIELDRWSKLVSVMGGAIEEEYVVWARLKVIDDIPLPNDREIQCEVEIYVKKETFDVDSGGRISLGEPVQVSGGWTGSGPFSLYVVMKP